MKYFTLLKMGWNPKNKLQDAAQKLAQNRTNLLIDAETLPQFVDDIKDRIKALNDYFSRCQPLKIDVTNTSNNNEPSIYCEGVFSIHLHLVKNN